MGVNRFTNPATGDVYDWEGNPSEEQAAGKTRNITHSAPVAGLGLIRQQAASDPYVLKFSGTLRSRNMHLEMWTWYQVCEGQTIYLTDFDGQQYEGQITHYEETRVRNLPRPGRDPSNFRFTYTLEFEVFRFLVGDLHDVGLAP